MILPDADRAALVEHVRGLSCGSCSARFSPALLGDLARGRVELTEDEAREVFAALADCGSLDEVRERVAGAAGYRG
jgi:hypothetical protein